MPNFIGPLLPTFGLEGEAKKAFKKAELLALTYALAITVAKKIPATAKPIGFVTGLELAPGAGVKLKPAFFYTMALPQPLGIIEPSKFGLPNSIGDPLLILDILTLPEREVVLKNQFQNDLREQALAAERMAENNRATATSLQRDFARAVLSGTAPRAPELGDVVGIPGLTFGGVPQVLATGRLPDRESPDSTVADLTSYAAVLARAAAGVLDRTGSIPVVQAAQPTTGTAAVIGQVQRLDQFGRSNPPDP